MSWVYVPAIFDTMPICSICQGKAEKGLISELFAGAAAVIGALLCFPAVLPDAATTRIITASMRYYQVLLDISLISLDYQRFLAIINRDSIHPSLSGTYSEVTQNGCGLLKALETFN